ncbi:unknown [Crocosphaera subtropica ATCC 51142]|uniref:Macrocin O-methyltransferase n=1 Tax=Crocosphaera subtropica (strain ATCC 51142 / BH68) TaxID=43989 RepID=B1WP82_CROS5|nr:TylF/MycF/NovP-related O-methyltransferase [Crocosphaera subtropica]ACB49864.1 unknown [Crocosphaera subtropica ATCC 51142]
MTNHFEKLQQEIDQQTEIIQQAENVILELQDKLLLAQELISARETSKFWKLRQKWFHFKKKLGLVQDEQQINWREQLALPSPLELPKMVVNMPEVYFSSEKYDSAQEYIQPDLDPSPVDLHFQYLQSQVKPFTLVGTERMQSLYNLSQRIEIEKIPGDVIECGVCNGGTAAILAHFATRSFNYNRTVWLFDSFAGMPKTTEEDEEEAKKYIGKDVGDFNNVLTILNLVNSDMTKVKIIEGWFENTFPKVHIPEIALLNIDADWYASVKFCLETFYDFVVPGGFISFDDYGHWPGCRKAVDEFFKERQLSYKLHEVDYTARWIQKV